MQKNRFYGLLSSQRPPVSIVVKFEILSQIAIFYYLAGNWVGKYVEKVKNFKEGQSETKAGENDSTGTATDTTTATDQSENNGLNL